jgi:hypothetical protein
MIEAERGCSLAPPDREHHEPRCCGFLRGRRLSWAPKGVRITLANYVGLTALTFAKLFGCDACCPTKGVDDHEVEARFAAFSTAESGCATHHQMVL